MEMAVDKMALRARKIGASRTSMGRKSTMWNVYANSLVPYPAQVIPPPPSALLSVGKFQRKFYFLPLPALPLSIVCSPREK